MQTYIATVQLLVAAPTDTDACDVISAALNDLDDTVFLDWAYLPDPAGEGFIYPALHAEIDPTAYTEGNFVARNLTPAP